MTSRVEHLVDYRYARGVATSTGLRRLRWVAVALGVGLPLVLACGRSQGARSLGAADPERQSEAENDVARDLMFNRGQPRAAITHALKALDLHPENAEAAHTVALIYLSFCEASVVSPDCHFDQVEKYARLATKNRDGFREAQNTLAVSLVHLKRMDEAIAILSPLTQDIQYATPEVAWGNLGWAYLEKGEVDRAIESLRQATALQPEFCLGQYWLGLAYEKKADYRSAREFFSRALDTDRSQCKGLQYAYTARARVLISLGAHDDARSDLERCRQLGNDTPAGRECAALAAKLR